MDRLSYYASRKSHSFENGRDGNTEYRIQNSGSIIQNPKSKIQNFNFSVFFRLCQITFIFILLSSQLFSGEFIEHGRIKGQDMPFRNPQAVSVSVDGTLYVVDSGNNRIQLFDKRGRFLRTIGGFGFKTDQFDQPTDIWTGSLINIYVADYNNRRVLRYDRSLNFISSLESNEAYDSDYQFEEVKSCALNSNNDLFVLDHSENKIIKFNRHGQPERSFGAYESGQGELQDPQQLHIFQNKFVLVSDAAAKAVFVFDFFGTFIRSVSTEVLHQPSGICVLPDDTILLADSGVNALFLINQNFSTLTSLTLKIRKPLSNLADVACWQDNQQIYLYLIDGNEIIFGVYK